MNADSSSAQSPANFQPVVPVVVESSVQLNNESDPQNVVEKEFDAYAAQYESALNEGLSVSGEGPEYFAQERVKWVAKLLHKRPEVTIRSIFGFRLWCRNCDTIASICLATRVDLGIRSFVCSNRPSQ